MNVAGTAGFFILFTNNGNTCFQIKSTTQLQLNDWTFVTVSYTDRVVRYYFNETYVGGGIAGCGWSGEKTTLNYFGNDYANNLGVRSTMQIFDFKIYNREISTDDRLTAFYNGTNNVQEMVKN